MEQREEMLIRHSFSPLQKPTEADEAGEDSPGSRCDASHRNERRSLAKEAPVEDGTIRDGDLPLQSPRGPLVGLKSAAPQKLFISSLSAGAPPSRGVTRARVTRRT